MNQFFEAFANMFRIPDLRKRLLFTLAMLAVYRLGAFLPTPGINTDVLQQFFNQNQGSVLGVIDLFSGGNFRRLTIFALGIMPYITASIILQLMTVVWPYLERLQKEGELGRRKITQYTRYLTIILSVVQSFSIAVTLERTGGPSNQPLVYNPGVAFVFMTILTLTTGSAFIMWLGEQITERGVGNGMSLIIFAGIVVGLPRAVADLFDKFRTAQWGPFTGLALIFLMALMIAVVGVIVFVEGGQRRIPVQYAKRVMGRKMMGGQMTYLPLRVNSGGVIPPIFASSLLTFPGTINLFLGRRFKAVDWIATNLAWGEPWYVLVYITLIIVFAFFYVGIVFNPTELADNMRKYGGFIPGIRPGRNTSEHIDRVLRRLTFVGGVYLAAVCLLPEWLMAGIHLQHLPVVGTWFDNHMWRFVLEGLKVNFYFGGTSLLIVVGVAMDTVQQIEAQLVMRNYEGFVKKGSYVADATADHLSAVETSGGLGRAVILLGPPGAGKGTQAQRVAKRYNLPHLSTGDMFRDHISRETDIGRRAKQMMARGELVPDEIVLGMVEDRIDEPDCDHGFVFDGFPRTLLQADDLQVICERHELDRTVVLHMIVDPHLLMRRLTGRRICKANGHIYNIYDRPPKQDGVCDEDGSELIHRHDDTEGVISERLAAYEHQTEPLVEYYTKRRLLHPVDAMASVDSVSASIAKILDGEKAHK